ncbi:MAG: DinB family protein [Ignavibacteriales bacterium]|nr:DinB family protein [Ignavibacteriales bacterium]
MKLHHVTSIELLLKLLDESYEKKAWHGPNLRGSIRGLTASQAAWRPSNGRHNIREIVVHCAYWKYIVRRRLLGEKRGSFPLKGSNWFKRPDVLSESAWSEDIILLNETHRSMRHTIGNLDEKDLLVIPKGSKVNNLSTILGIASHDLYHAGQIQLLKRLGDEQ